MREDHLPPVATGGGVAHEVHDLGGVHPLVAAAEVAAELGGELEPVRRAACALEDAGERLAGVGEGLALVEGDVEQPIPAPADR